MNVRVKLAIAFLVAGLFAGVIAILLPRSNDDHDQTFTAAATAAGYVTSSECRECHPKQHSSWHSTWHRTMTQSATSESVVAPFDNVRLESRGETIELSRKDDQFFATRIESDGDQDHHRESRQIVMTTGSHLMQTYWVQVGKEFRQLPWFFHIEEKMWIPSADTFLNPPPGDQNSGQWNNSCIKCHTTGAVPGFDGSSFNTTVAEMGIACEACHGPGEKHVDWHKSQDKENIPDDEVTLLNPARISHRLASQVCAQCHSSSQPRDRRRWLAEGSRYRPGEDHTLEFRHAEPGSTVKEDEKYLKDSFWSDGTCRVGGDEYQGLADSACFQKGELSCMVCHSMHNSDPTDQLRFDAESNEACLVCHSEFRDKLEQHTHHSARSSGSNCYNCHMPHTTFALLKAIRSHRVDIPQTGTSTVGSRPNACNLCHLDRPLSWAAEKLTEWYERPNVEMDETDRTTSAATLWLLRGDAMQRVISAWSMSWEPARQVSGSEWQAPLLAHSLTDSYSAIRFVAWRSLRNLPGFESFAKDFPDDKNSQEEASTRAIDLWRKRDVRVSDPAAVLLTPDGLPDRAAIRKIKTQRDDRAIKIFE